jgi:hypothetical protein
MTDAERLDELEDSIKELKKDIQDLNGEMDKLETSASGLSRKVGDTGNLLRDAVTSVGNIRSEFAGFMKDSSAQYKFAEALAEKSKQTAVNIGLSVGRSKEFTKQFNRATAEVTKFGFQASDVGTMMEYFTDQSGRARIITPEEVKNIALLNKGLGVGLESSSELYERMELMGVGTAKATQKINEMVVSSQKLGLNASKVAKTLSNNFDRMSSMSFKGGVKGMTKMAQLAVKMRMDVSDMLGMAEKFYEPEAAIEAAANLQMLGGDIAQAFGDPFETMYLARNKPEELAEKVGDMVENMMQFNEETGEYEFPAEVRMQLKSAGEQLGINTDKMIEMARNAAKIKDIKMNVSGNIQDEDMREGLASMARMKDGKFVVDFKGEELDVGDIGMDQAAEILAAPKDSDEAIMDMAYNSMTTNQILKNILESLKTGFVAEVNRYEITEDVLAPSMRGLFNGVEKQLESALKIFKESPLGDVVELTRKQAEAMGIASEEGLTKFFEEDFAEILGESLSEWAKEGWKEFTGDLEEIAKQLKQQKGGENKQHDGADGKIEKDFILRSSGQVTSFTDKDDIIGAKKGGPLDKLMDKGLPNNMAGGTTNSKMEFGNLNISGRIEVVSPDGSSTNMDMSSIKPQIESMIINQLNGTFREGGVPSSKQTTDYMGQK